MKYRAYGIGVKENKLGNLYMLNSTFIQWLHFVTFIPHTNWLKCYDLNQFEPEYEQTNKMTCAPSKDPD